MFAQSERLNTRVGIVDLGISNLGSIDRILREIVDQVEIVKSSDQLGDLDRLVLPGVGAFPAAMQRLMASGLDKGIRDFVHGLGRPLLGICLGMQLLGEVGEEHEVTGGLGFIGGRVRRFRGAASERIPHVGWNSVTSVKHSPLMDGVVTDTDFYFVHSYLFEVTETDSLVATCENGETFAAVIENGNIFGVQFHPEKSSFAGRAVLRNFCGYSAC